MTTQLIDPYILEDLEKKLDRLLEHYQAVKTENQLLRLRQQELQEEKVQLLEQATATRNRVEALIKRLKTLEQVDE